MLPASLWSGENEKPLLSDDALAFEAWERMTFGGVNAPDSTDWWIWQEAYLDWSYPHMQDVDDAAH